MPERLSAGERERLREVLADSGLTRILSVLRERWVSYGRTAGQVTVETREEAFALSGLLPRSVRVGSRVRAQMLEDALLHHTRFACTLREALEVHTGERLVSRTDRAAARRGAWEACLSEIHEKLGEADVRKTHGEAARRWLEEDDAALRQRWGRSAGQLRDDMRVLIGALAHLPAGDETIALAVLANRASGNPHALNAGTSAASLLDRLLAHMHPEVESPLTRGAEGRDELLTAAGIAKDRTSPKVDTFGLRAQDPSLAPLLRLPTLTLTLRMAEALRGGRLGSADGVVHVVENPSVFDQLVERMEALAPEARPTLVCTNGRMNLADRVLLDDLVASGGRIRYSGDFDPDGLSIACSVLRRYRGQAVLWRMTAADYEAALTNQSTVLVEANLSTFGEIPASLRATMVRKRRIAFQEALLEALWSDLTAKAPRA